MRILEPGKISDHVYFLGDYFITFYLIDAPQKALIDAGMSVYVKELTRQIEEKIGGFKNLSYIFLTHSHYDHVGLVSYIKRVNPEVKVVAHPYAKKVFQNPRAMEIIRELNKESLRFKPELEEDWRSAAEIDKIEVDTTPEHRDVFDLGNDVNLTIFYTPGHTKDSVTYYLSPDKAVFGSDGLGVYTGSGSIMAEFLSDYREYLNSIKFLKNLDIELLCLPHSGVVKGKSQIQRHIQQHLEETISFRNRIISLYRRFGDIEKVVKTITMEDYEKEQIFQPIEAYLINLRAMVKSALESVGEEEFKS